MLGLLREMAARKTNAVLHLLADVGQLQKQCRYPEDGLLFAQDRWRAFYHCHEEVQQQSEEHGHFHLFTDMGDKTWSHVAGLSVDAEGQPLQWFTVNRWVSDGPWLECESLVRQLEYISSDSMADNLTADWLAMMMQLYRDDLRVLLKKRDAYIQQCLNGRDLEQAIEDRELYTLSTLDINLQKMLEKNLLYRRTGSHYLAQDSANDHTYDSPGE